MKTKLLIDLQPLKTWAIVFETGEEVMAGLTSFALEHSVSPAHLTAIGAFSDAVLGYFNWETKQYDCVAVDGQVEVVSLIGDIALENKKPKVHAHSVLGKPGGVTVGGHFLEGRVRPTLEVILNETPKHLERQFDPESGIALIQI